MVDRQIGYICVFFLRYLLFLKNESLKKKIRTCIEYGKTNTGINCILIFLFVFDVA